MSGLQTPPFTQLGQNTNVVPSDTVEPVRHEKYYNTTVPDPIVIRVCYRSSPITPTVLTSQLGRKLSLPTIVPLPVYAHWCFGPNGRSATSP